MSSALTVVLIVAGVATLIGSVAGSVSLARSSSLKASFDAVILANGELRQANNDLRVEAEADRRSLERQISEERARFESKLAVEREKRAVLEGRVIALTSDLGRMIVEAVVRNVRETAILTALPPPPVAQTKEQR